MTLYRDTATVNMSLYVTACSGMFTPHSIASVIPG